MTLLMKAGRGKRSLLLLLIMTSALLSYAQRNKPLDIARHYMANNMPDSALVAYKIAYEDAPFDQKIYQEYFDLLINLKKYPEAETLAKYMTEIRKEDPGIKMDMAQVYELKGDKKAYANIVRELIESVSGMSDYDVRKLANTFQQKGQIGSAIDVFTKVSGQDKRVGRFDKELMYLYIENNEIEKAIDIFSDIHTYQPGIENDMKSRLLMYIEKDIKHRQKLEKLLRKQAGNKKNNQYIYVGLLTWLNQLSGRYDDALGSLIALDKKEKGSMMREIFQMGMEAVDNRQHGIAEKAMEYIIQSKGDNVYAESAEAVLIKNDYIQLYTTRPVDQQLVSKSMNRMAHFFTQYPDRKSKIEYLWYMDVIGKYARKPEQAIIMLDSMLTSARLSKEYIGMGKLALGDYQLLAGRIWDANLTYAQVDKLYRQDAMGEEARYKQAKLAFYRGDFEWAQTQLNVLKASTTELISNDAMSLSIMITENTVKDSTFLSLELYAKADLMIFQYQYEDADSILNELIKQYPDNDLMDDVYMLKAQMAKDEGRFADAVGFYKVVIDKYKDDVLADDALLKTGEIYEVNLGDKQQALAYYETLILEFPNSTLTTLARTRMDTIKKGSETKPLQ